MLRPKISIIVPIYNIREYVERCIASLSGQTYSNLEIILVDDGSTDGSGKICDRMAKRDKRIVVVHKKNGGLSDARNVGMDSATGKYIFFVDGDDWLDADAITLLSTVAMEKKADIVECGFKEIYKDYIFVDNECNGDTQEIKPKDAVIECMQWERIKPVAWNKLYSSDIVKGVRYPVGRLHEDEFTTHKFLYNAKKIVFLDLALYNYDRVKEASITSKFKVKNLDACEAMRQKIYFVMEHPELVDSINAVCNVYCFTLFDNLSKCVENGVLDSKEVEKTVNLAIGEKEKLKKYKVEMIYRQCLDILDKRGIEACVQKWNARKGIK